MTDALFSIGNWTATAGWAALLAALYVERFRGWGFMLAGLVIPAALSACYLGLFILTVSSGAMGAGVDFSTPNGVSAALASDLGATTGWFHYLAFDLVIGAWIARDGLAHGASRWALVPILLATFLAGPIGFLAYLGLRALSGRTAEPLSA